MHITVKLFALMREKAGTDTVRLDVPDGASVEQAIQVLQTSYPVLTPYLATTRFSLSTDFVDAETRLTEGDEVALIPPVSGGA